MESLAAGEYSQIVCKNSYKNIPMRLFCRESLFNHFSKMADFIFEVTNKSMDLFENYFQCGFKFSKYD